MMWGQLLFFLNLMCAVLIRIGIYQFCFFLQIWELDLDSDVLVLFIASVPFSV